MDHPAGRAIDDGDRGRVGAIEDGNGDGPVPEPGGRVAVQPAVERRDRRPTAGPIEDEQPGVRRPRRRVADRWPRSTGRRARVRRTTGDRGVLEPGAGRIESGRQPAAMAASAGPGRSQGEDPAGRPDRRDEPAIGIAGDPAGIGGKTGGSRIRREDCLVRRRIGRGASPPGCRRGPRGLPVPPVPIDAPGDEAWDGRAGSTDDEALGRTVGIGRSGRTRPDHERTGHGPDRDREGERRARSGVSGSVGRRERRHRRTSPPRRVPSPAST